jgi:hypothetical protein
VCLVAPSCGLTTRAPRVRVPRHVARLVVDYFAYDARSGALARRAARRRLLHLRLASGCLDFSLVGRTGSRRASSHCISRRDYSLSGLHRLYCTYAVHPDAPSRRWTSRQSAALALAMCPFILLCIVTTHHTTQRIYFNYAVRPGASARRAARHAACHAARL